MRYLLVQPLGEGGMASVFRGYDQRLRAWRAVKIMAPALARKVKLRQRFEGEAQTMALLEHRHIVRVYDVGEDGDAAYIVMELLEGGCLVDWLEEHGPMPPRMAVACTIEIAEGLVAAHAKGVIHRDIKPHNVLISNDGECRITDFGIARINDGDMSMTKTGAVMGTWGYMAPEQRVDAKHVDGRADEYALGATLYSLLTNKTPMDLFAADRESALMQGIPGELVDVILKAAEYKREARYPDVGAFATALRGVFNDLPPIPPEVPPLARAPKPPPPVPNPADYTPKLTTARTAASSTMAWAGGGEDEAMAAAEAGGVVAVVPAAQPAAAPEASIAGLHSNPTLLNQGEGGNHLGGPTLSGAGGLPSLHGTVEPAPHRRTSGLAVLGLTGGLFFLGLTMLVLAGTAVFVFRPPAVTADSLLEVATDVATEVQVAEVAIDAATEVQVAELATEAPPIVADPAPRPRVTTPRVTTPPVQVKPPEPQVVAVPVANTDCITAKPPSRLGPGAPFQVSLCDDNRSAVVVMHWRPSGGEWHTSQMPFQLGAYRVKLPTDQVYSKGVDYWISAGEHTYGNAAAPKHID